MIFVLEMMNLVFEMMNLALQMMNCRACARFRRPAVPTFYASQTGKPNTASNTPLMKVDGLRRPTLSHTHTHPPGLHTHTYTDNPHNPPLPQLESSCVVISIPSQVHRRGWALSVGHRHTPPTSTRSRSFYRPSPRASWYFQSIIFDLE